MDAFLRYIQELISVGVLNNILWALILGIVGNIIYYFLLEDSARNLRQLIIRLFSQIFPVFKKLNHGPNRYITVKTRNGSNVKLRYEDGTTEEEARGVAELLMDYDAGLVSEEQVKEAMQFRSWRKWAKSNDETGFIELAESRPLEPKVRAFLELELGMVKKIKKPIEADILYKKRLLNLLNPKKIDK